MKSFFTIIFCSLITVGYAQYYWEAQNSTTTDWICCVDFTPTGKTVGIFGTVYNGQIGRTDDGGESWSIVHSFGSTIVNDCYIDDALNCIAVTSTEIYKSTDGGFNWTLKYSNPNSVFWSIEESNGRIFASKGGYSTNYGNHLYYSDDLGETWDSVSTIFGQILDVSFQGNHGILVASGDLFVSSDLGDTWTQLNGLPHVNLILDVEMINSTDYITVGRLGDVYYTQDSGSNWTNIDLGTTEKLWSVEFGNATNGIIGGENGTLFTSNTGISGPWNVSSFGGSSTHISDVHPHSDDNYAWFGNASGEIFKAPTQGAVDILDLIGPDSLCQDDTYNYSIEYEVSQGVAENPAFAVSLNGDNISGGYSEVTGVFGPGIYSFDLSSAVNLSTEGTYEYVVTAVPDINNTTTVLDNYGLIETENIFIKERGTLTANSPLYFCPGDEVTLQATGNGLFNWYTQNTLLSNNTITPVEDNEMYIVEADQGLCQLYDTVMVYLDPNCPNIISPVSDYAFSPNSDGVNDIFVIDYLENTENHVYFYNKWGDLISEFTNYDNLNVVWDGTHNGKAVSSGTYYFISEYDQNKTHQAWVQVVK